MAYLDPSSFLTPIGRDGWRYRIQLQITNVSGDSKTIKYVVDAYGASAGSTWIRTSASQFYVNDNLLSSKATIYHEGLPTEGYIMHSGTVTVTGTSFKVKFVGGYYDYTSNDCNITQTVSIGGLTYTYSFNPNGGSGGPSSATKTAGVDFTFPSGAPTRSGYNFKGWSTNSGGSGTLYQPGRTYGGLSDGNVTWYAAWEKITYAVTYNANGGSNPPPAQEKIHGQHLILSSAKPGTSKRATLTYDARGGTVSPSTKAVDLTFLSWNDKANGSGTSYKPGGSYKTDGPVTLYAQWGSGAIGSLPTPTREGCEFIGWFTDPDDGTQVTSSYEISSATTIYAHYNYTVSYDCDGGEPESLPSQTKYHGVNLKLTTMKPWKLGMELKGWATSRGGSISYGIGGIYANNAPITLYAIYGVAEYTVRFEDGYTGAILKTEQVKAGGAATPPPAPKREGYDFVGWMGEYKCVYGDSVVYAMWSSCPVYVMNNKHEWVKLWDYIKLKEK